MPDEWDVETEEGAPGNVFSEVNQGSLSYSVTAESMDTELSMGLEDVGLSENGTFVKTDGEDAQETGKIPFPSKAKVFGHGLFI